MGDIAIVQLPRRDEVATLLMAIAIVLTGCLSGDEDKITLGEPLSKNEPH